jgi:hypothetical protein
MSTIEKLLGRKSSGSGLENREYGNRVSRADYATTLYPQKLALTSLTSSYCLVSVVRSQTKATDLLLLLLLLMYGGDTFQFPS